MISSYPPPFEWAQKTCIRDGFSLYGRKLYYDCKNMGSLIGNARANPAKNNPERPYAGRHYVRLGTFFLRNPALDILTDVSQKNRPDTFPEWQETLNETNSILDGYAAEKFHAFNDGKVEQFESEPSYSLSAESNRGVRPMSNNNMMVSVMVLGGAALVGFYFDRIVTMFRGRNGNEDSEEFEAHEEANQGYIESWQGGNSGISADDPRLQATTLQGAVDDEPYIKYNYDPYAGPSQVFHDEQTRQTGFFEY